MGRGAPKKALSVLPLRLPGPPSTCLTTCKSPVVAAEVRSPSSSHWLHRRHGRRADALWGLKPADPGQPALCQGVPACHRQRQCVSEGARAPVTETERSRGCPAPAPHRRRGRGRRAFPAAAARPWHLWLRSKAHGLQPASPPRRGQVCPPHGRREGAGPCGLPDPPVLSPQNQRRRGKGPDGLYQVSAMPVSARCALPRCRLAEAGQAPCSCQHLGRASPGPPRAASGTRLGSPRTGAAGALVPAQEPLPPGPSPRTHRPDRSSMLGPAAASAASLAHQ